MTQKDYDTIFCIIMIIVSFEFIKKGCWMFHVHYMRRAKYFFIQLVFHTHPITLLYLRSFDANRPQM